MTIIAGTFQTTGQSAGGKASADITHTAAESDGISRHNTFLVALIAQNHTVAGAVAFVKVERTKVNPRRTAHLLIHTELSRYALMPHRVVSIVHTSRNGLVADVYCIAACLGDVGLIGYLTLIVAVFDSLCLSGCTSLEGILIIHIDTGMKGKAHRIRPLPAMRAVGLLIDSQIGAGCIVVYDYLVPLPVSFPRGEYHRSGILQHRY